MRKIILFFSLVFSCFSQENIWNEAASGINVDPYLLWSIAKNESSFNKNSVNYNKMDVKTRDEAINYLSTLSIKTKPYGKNKQHLSIDCKTKEQAEKAISYALTKKINFDIGIMNINSIHLKTLSKHNISAYDLLEPELNVKVGAWELKGCINRYGYTADAVNCYNGMSYENRVLNKYASKIHDTMQKAKGQRSYVLASGNTKNITDAKSQDYQPNYLGYEESVND